MTATAIGLSVISIIVVLVAYGSCKAASKSDKEIEKIIKKQQDEKTNLSAKRRKLSEHRCSKSAA